MQELAPTTNCILWVGSVNNRGYGQAYDENKIRIGAHKLSYILYKGPVEKGLVVRHTCHNPLCINYNHLIVGTSKENSQDMVDSGRSLKGSKHNNNTLTEDDVVKIKILLQNKIPYKKIACLFNITDKTVGHIKRGYRWSHVTINENPKEHS